MVVYLSGTNYETNKPELERLKAYLFDLGCTIIVPEEKALNKLKWSENLQLRLSFLNSSNAIYMLPNWKDSVMARIELTSAMNDKKHLCFSPKDIRELKTTLDR